MKDTNLLLEIENLTWGYPNSPSLIFDRFNFKLYRNDFCFVIWKSWVWKTTLVRFLIRQLRPPRKMIYFKKEDISRFWSWEVQKYRRKFWVIFQDYKLIDWKTVKENIAYPLQLAWENPTQINSKIKDILFELWLHDKSDVKIPYLSWWEKQRVAIARALIGNPEFIIADEPTGNLDTESSKKIADTLIELNKKGYTILFITHDLNLIDYVKLHHRVKIVRMWEVPEKTIEDVQDEE